jgi:hypothetical protein
MENENKFVYIIKHNGKNKLLETTTFVTFNNKDKTIKYDNKIINGVTKIEYLRDWSITK